MFWNLKKNIESAKTAKDVIQEELKFIKGPNDPKDIWGLAISGGGIRSASVGLGVMQALVAAPRKSILSRMDYLSTVSGGGYIGSALTWFLQKGLPGGGEAGTEPDNFPLGQKGVGARTEKNGNVLNFIRQHGNYLIPGSGMDVFSLIGVTLRSIFVSLLVYFFILVALLTGFNLIGLFEQYSLNIFGLNKIFMPVFLWIASAALIVLMISAIYFSFRTRFPMSTAARYRHLISGQKFLGYAWKFILLTSLLGVLVYIKPLLPEIWHKIVVSVGSISIGTITGLFQYKKSAGNSSSGSGLPSTIGLIAAAFALDYGLILAAYLSSEIVTNLLGLAIVAVIALVLGFCTNLNLVGLHRMYRDRLMETFMPNADNVIKNKWGKATDADTARLDKMNEKANRPYHLINSNIVLVDSPTTKFRSRGGDSFLLSKLYCGSDSTGYVQTKDYMAKRNGITLATAMAISGAAVNPNTGASGKGVMRNRIVSFLLGILNLRLGFWAENPKHPPSISSVPNFIHPGLTSDVLGLDLSEERDDIQLTDGGHFENLALYELFRRKVKVIIVSDGGTDENYGFIELANAIEKARVDFGITIRFDKKYDMNDLLPGSCQSKKEKFLTEKYKLSERGFAVADIKYSENIIGKLIYIKPVLTTGLPADIYGYKSVHWDFPNQTTADQFFDEEQFEAYRELGYQLTWQMLKSKIGKYLLRSMRE